MMVLRKNPTKDGTITLFKRTIDYGVFYNLLTENDGSVPLTLSLVPGYTNITATFDQFTIAYAEIRFKKLSQQVTLSNTAADVVTCPRIVTAIDRDDSILTTAALLREYGNCKVYNSDTSFVVKVKPKVGIALYLSTGFNSFGIDNDVSWVDAGYPLTPFNTMKFAYTPATVTAVFGHNVDVVVSVLARYPK